MNKQPLRFIRTCTNMAGILSFSSLLIVQWLVYPDQCICSGGVQGELCGTTLLPPARRRDRPMIHAKDEDRWRDLEANAHLPEVQEIIRQEIQNGTIRVRPKPEGGIRILPVRPPEIQERG